MTTYGLRISGPMDRAEELIDSVSACFPDPVERRSHMISINRSRPFIRCILKYSENRPLGTRTTGYTYADIKAREDRQLERCYYNLPLKWITLDDWLAHPDIYYWSNLMRRNDA